MKKWDFKLTLIGGLLSVLLLVSGCEEFSGFLTPTFSTPTISKITFTSAIIDGGVRATNNEAIITSGFCWSISHNPTIENDKTVEKDETYFSNVTDLIANTTYYIKPYTTTNDGTYYGDEISFTTMSLENTKWKFTTIYEGNFIIYSQVDLHNDNTTKFDEMDYPDHCPGCFITYGSWKIEGNNFTYIWEGTEEDINQSTYIYKGTISEKSIQGVYEHVSAPKSNWYAELL